MKIREFCKMKKITQEKLAEDLNVDVRTIRRWESSTPSTRIILKLANYFEVFPYNLLEENEKMPEFSNWSIRFYRFCIYKKGGFSIN